VFHFAGRSKTSIVIRVHLLGFFSIMMSTGKASPDFMVKHFSAADEENRWSGLGLANENNGNPYAPDHPVEASIVPNLGVMALISALCSSRRVTALKDRSSSTPGSRPMALCRTVPVFSH